MKTIGLAIFILCTLVACTTQPTPTNNPSSPILIEGADATIVAPLQIPDLNPIEIPQIPALPVPETTATDTLGPVITNLSISPTAGSPGEVITLNASAHDPSGIKTIIYHIAYPQHNSHDGYLWRTNCNFDGTIESSCTLSEPVDHGIHPKIAGNYTIPIITIVDNVDNIATYYQDGRVENTGSETHGLNIPSITLTSDPTTQHGSTTVTDSDIVTLSAEATTLAVAEQGIKTFTITINVKGLPSVNGIQAKIGYTDGLTISNPRCAGLFDTNNSINLPGMEHENGILIGCVTFDSVHGDGPVMKFTVMPNSNADGQQKLWLVTGGPFGTIYAAAGETVLPGEIGEPIEIN